MKKTIYMEKGVLNVSKLDASVRLVLGMALILAVLLTNISGLALFFTAIVSIPTVLFGIMRWDPVYQMLSISTCRKDRSFSLKA